MKIKNLEITIPTRVKIIIGSVIGISVVVSISLIITNNISCRKQRLGNVDFGSNNTFYSPAIINGEVYLPKSEPIKFYPEEKRVGKEKTSVIGKVFSVDEIIAKTPICVFQKVAGECPVEVCLASSSQECQEREDCMELDNVITHATHPTPNYWNIRAKGFYLLGHANNEMLKDKHFRFSVTWEVILDTIANAINNDPNILVRREALKAFDKLTDFSRKDDFDFGSATKWWNTSDNKERAIEELKNK